MSFSARLTEVGRRKKGPGRTGPHVETIRSRENLSNLSELLEYIVSCIWSLGLYDLSLRDRRREKGLRFDDR